MTKRLFEIARAKITRERRLPLILLAATVLAREWSHKALRLHMTWTTTTPLEAQPQNIPSATARVTGTVAAHDQGPAHIEISLLKKASTVCFRCACGQMTKKMSERQVTVCQSNMWASFQNWSRGSGGVVSFWFVKETCIDVRFGFDFLLQWNKVRRK